MTLDKKKGFEFTRDDVFFFLVGVYFFSFWCVFIGKLGQILFKKKFCYLIRKKENL